MSKSNNVMILVNNCTDDCYLVGDLDDAKSSMIELMCEGYSFDDFYLIESEPKKFKVDIKICDC